jgi:hypothetical protein
MSGSSIALSPQVKFTNATPSASLKTDGSPDITKETTLETQFNVDSGTAGVGIVCFGATAGASQQFTSSAATWLIIKFGLKTQKGGILIKADGTAFDHTALPVGAVYANCIAWCSDGLYACAGDGNPWAIISSYALT